MVGVADDVHFGQVRVGFRLEVLRLDDFGLEEGEGGEAPAGAAARLVLHRSDRDFLDGGELIVGCFDRRGGLTGLAGCDDGNQGRRGEKEESFFHINGCLNPCSNSQI